MRILSLFDGMSVAQQALKELNIPVEKYYASEIDKYAIAVTQSNFPNTIQLGDIAGLKFNEEIDLLIGGSPCQDLSIAKKNREGLKGQRSGLFYDYVRIRNEVKPKYFILEQVEILLPEDRDILLKDILQPPAEVDERMVIKGKSFAVTVSYNGAVAWNSIQRKQRTMVRIGQLNSGGQGDRIYSPDGKSINLSANGGGRGAKTGLYAVKMIEENMQIRKLTPTECLRLQSMPDDYFDKAIANKKPISNTQRYKMCGNALNFEVIKYILKQI